MYFYNILDRLIPFDYLPASFEQFIFHTIGFIHAIRLSFLTIYETPFYTFIPFSIPMYLLKTNHQDHK